MSLLTQAYLLERYGPRLSLDDMAKELGRAKNTLYSQVSAGTLEVKTYVDGGKRWCDYRDMANYFDDCRARAKL